MLHINNVVFVINIIKWFILRCLNEIDQNRYTPEKNLSFKAVPQKKNNFYLNTLFLSSFKNSISTGK